MFGVFMCSVLIGDNSAVKPLMDEIEYAVGFNPFSSFGGFLITALSVALAGACIYLIDKKLLSKAGLTVEQAKKSALRLALITAPYLYFFPSELIYRDWI